MTAPIARTLRRILIALGVAALVSALVPAALAQTHLRVDDSGVDYTNHDLDEAYIGMDFHTGWLVFVVDDEAFEGAMPAIAFHVPDLEKEDFFGNDIGAELADIRDLTWRAVGRDDPHSAALHEVSYHHEGVTVAEAVELYVAAFDALGFDVDVARSPGGSVWVATFTHGDDTVRVRLHGSGADVLVDLITL